MEKKKSKMTKMYKKKKRIESDNNEIHDYLTLLNNKRYLTVSIPGIDEEIELYKESWDNIWKKTKENIGHFIGHVLFYIQIQTDKNEIDDYKNILLDNRESKQIFFESIFNTSKPLEAPFDMTENDFDKFNRFLNRKK